jgi:hypothetical protein
MDRAADHGPFGQLYVKVSVDARRRGLGTTWMRLKLDLRGRYAPSATILDTPTRNAPKHLVNTKIW